MAQVEVTRTYLQMRAANELLPERSERSDLRLEWQQNCPPSFYRFLYSTVGQAFHWTDRLPWTDERIREHLAGPIQVWVLYQTGAPAGYFELKRWDDDSVEVAYFGLLPEFIGGGLGKYLLTCAVETAWAMTPTRVWLHTCTLDHPSAMPNYLKRGFLPFKEERYMAEVES
jgi:GNAT superfamily N-acetyltransferase